MDMDTTKFFMVALVVFIAILKSIATKSKDKKKQDAALGKTKAPPMKSVSAQKREQAQRVEQWRAAKTKQDDAQQLHSIKMDTCESRLENLRVLYDAGILDREEYAQRVSRVKNKHNQF